MGAEVVTELGLIDRAQDAAHPVAQPHPVLVQIVAGRVEPSTPEIVILLVFLSLFLGFAAR